MGRCGVVALLERVGWVPVLFKHASLAVSRSPGAHKQLYHSTNSASELMKVYVYVSAPIQRKPSDTSSDDSVAF